MSIHFGDKNVKEIRYGQKKVKEVWYGDKKVWPSAPSINLDLNNGQPIGRMNDGELWFRVNVKDSNEPFKIAVNGSGDSSYDWDISVDGAPSIRETGDRTTEPIILQMPVGKHYVKITPHNGVTAGWARCLGNSNTTNSWNDNTTNSWNDNTTNYWNNNTTNYWNNNKGKLEFGLEWLPGYAFMEGDDIVGDDFLNFTWADCASLTSMPHGFNLPQGITSVGDNFLNYTWYGCTSLTSMPSGFNIPQGIVSVGDSFLYNTWADCTALTSMPSGFNLPQGITSVGSDFLYSTWENCTSLTSISNGFNLPHMITEVGRNFLVSTWKGCASLTSMPDGFNIPQGLRRVGANFLTATWRDCRSLVSIPNGFKIPEGVLARGSAFMYIWYNCTSLTSNSPAEPLRFPNIILNTYAEGCFGGSCPITPDSPTPGSSVMVHRG